MLRSKVVCDKCGPIIHRDENHWRLIFKQERGSFDDDEEGMSLLKIALNIMKTFNSILMMTMDIPIGN